MNYVEHTADLYAELEDGIAAIQKIVDCWEQGDLARAVNEAEDWAVNAAQLLQDIKGAAK